MSLTFTQIVDLIDDNVGSSPSYTIYDKTRDINLALDRAFSIIFSVGGIWQFDDSNHSDSPTLTATIYSGTREYSFASDNSSNLTIEILKVMVADENGNFREITPVGEENEPSNYFDGLNVGGQPNTYKKVGSKLLLDPIPNYTEVNGLKVYINREGSYFVYSDTTKKPGIAGIFHEYLALRPSYQFAYRKSLANGASLRAETIQMEQDMEDHYRRRDKDFTKVLLGEPNCAR